MRLALGAADEAAARDLLGGRAPAEGQKGAVYDVKSGAPGKASDGTAFAYL